MFLVVAKHSKTFFQFPMFVQELGGSTATQRAKAGQRKYSIP